MRSGDELWDKVAGIWERFEGGMMRSDGLQGAEVWKDEGAGEFGDAIEKGGCAQACEILEGRGLAVSSAASMPAAAVLDWRRT